ncbi:MAG: hypothetical protein ACJ79S_04655 [Gemmatimonadaceae bacterium]
MRLPFEHDERIRYRPHGPHGGDSLSEAIDAAARTGEWRTEPLRAAVVGFAREAHDQALQLEETLSAIRFRLRGLCDRLTAGARAELLAAVQWWAVHGYHRAD